MVNTNEEKQCRLNFPSSFSTPRFGDSSVELQSSPVFRVNRTGLVSSFESPF